MNFEEPIGDMDTEIRVDPDQIGIKGGVVNLRQRQPVCDDRLAQLLIRINDDMGGIEQPGLRQQAGDSAAASVGGQDSISEGCLM